MATEATQPLPVPVGAELDRRFEAFVLDWDGTAVPDRRADASGVRAAVERLCALGADVAVITGTHIGNVDPQLGARPAGPGRLFLCLNRGSEVYRVDADGPTLVERRQATPEEDSSLDAAAAEVVARLAEKGLRAEIVSQRLNRRKIDLIPEPEWTDPPKARIDELLAAVERRLAAAGLDLRTAVELALEAGRDAGLPDPKVTSDAKHVEIGLTDKADSSRWVFAELWRHGIGPGLVLVGGDEFGPLGGLPGSDSLLLVPEAGRSTAVSVGREPDGVPEGVIPLGGGPAAFVALLDDQVRRRELGAVPLIDEDAAWTVAVAGLDLEEERGHEAVLELADGRIGSNSPPLWTLLVAEPRVLAAGVYTGSGPETTLVEAPVWQQVEGRPLPSGRLRRVLDLHTGVLRHVLMNNDGGAEAALFSSLAHPGTVAFRLAGPDALLPVEAALSTARSVEGTYGGVAAASVTRRREDGSPRVERVGAYVTDTSRVPRPEEAAAALAAADSAGFETLLTEHRAAWAGRWEAADVVVDGDAELTRAVRFALFTLMASVRDDGEAAVGARGIAGPGYRGHVFWDGDVFVLPFLAATHPPAARAMLEYRLRRLPAALAAARKLERAGARFPWESAATGEDVTPRLARLPDGRVVPIRTGELEEHITADVAWAAACYLDWTGDPSFESGARELLLETARYWASRIQVDRQGRAHIYGVIGPDEYHEPVDDNAFTNVMARWNLRRAAALATEPERGRWLQLADALVDGYDPDTGLYEEFAGFFGLEPLIIAEVAPRRPIVADLLLGAERVAGAQVVKQADVLMMHHLVPSEVAPGSLGPNLDFYEPRTAHGSSLSPAVHAALFPRAGRPEDALPLLQLAAGLDLDVTSTTAGGLHLATMGGLWQALVMGFAGVRPDGDALAVDPRLPGAWNGLDLRLRFRGVPLRLRAEHEVVAVEAEAPVHIRVGDAPTARGRRLRWTKAKDSWAVSR
jgi:Glycosyl hydrolase family 65 central catalytic domain/Glycosyl hydrolase family 65, C-terminal domain